MIGNMRITSEFARGLNYKRSSDIKPLTFTNNGNVTASIRIVKNNNQTTPHWKYIYSLDNGTTWTDYLNSAISFNVNDNVLFKAKPGYVNGTNNTTSKYDKILITTGNNINVSGNVQWLINSDELLNNVNAHLFYYMFTNLTKLLTAPKLPATVLASYCYASMFYGCTFLSSAPDLPATTLADYCYSNMFLGCTSLTSAPELPATTLADYCYSHMFRNCTSLTSARDLPATTLANKCYSAMFGRCTSLSSAPELPATTLADGCYVSMFYGCTFLSSAPELPATTLADYCYSGMFNGCTSLTSAPELPATTLADYCYLNIFQGCTKLKYMTFPNHNFNDAVSIISTYTMLAGTSLQITIYCKDCPEGKTYR